MADRMQRAFREFLLRNRKALQRISNHTRREYELADVENETWLLMQRLKEQKGYDIDLSNPAHEDLLIRFLYRKLVNYQEKQVRFAARLDQSPQYEDSEHEENPLMRALAADIDLGPLETLLRTEYERHAARSEPSPHQSRASAYVQLLRHFDGKMSSVADYLLISVSHCYRCMATARVWAEHQRSLTYRVTGGNKKLLARPWRKFRTPGMPRQIALNFASERDLWTDD